MTCNPHWLEIKNNVHTNSKPQDRYNIVNRVFHLKVQKLSTLINKHHIFGPPRCYMYVVEWHKRGLPYIHLLLWLRNKIRPDQINSVITAEIPNKEKDQELYDIVVKHMVHRLCGAFNRDLPCMIEEKFSKKFPKQFQSNISSGDDGYPKYRRLLFEKGGKICTIRNYEIDNR